MNDQRSGCCKGQLSFQPLSKTGVVVGDKTRRGQLALQAFSE